LPPVLLSSVYFLHRDLKPKLEISSHFCYFFDPMRRMNHQPPWCDVSTMNSVMYVPYLKRRQGSLMKRRGMHGAAWGLACTFHNPEPSVAWLPIAAKYARKVFGARCAKPDASMHCNTACTLAQYFAEETETHAHPSCSKRRRLFRNCCRVNSPHSIYLPVKFLGKTRLSVNRNIDHA